MSSRTAHTAETTVHVVRGIAQESKEKNVPFMAGSIAYSAFVSLLPLVLLLTIAASVLGGGALADRVRGLTESYLTPSGQTLLIDSISQAGS